MRGTDISRDAESTVRSRANDAAEQFDAWPLHNEVSEAVLEDDQLALAADVAVRAEEPNNMRRVATQSGAGGDALIRALSQTEIEIREHLDLRVEEIVAEACATVLGEIDTWCAEDGEYCEEYVAAEAKREAADWLLVHDEVAERVELGATGEAVELKNEEGA